MVWFWCSVFLTLPILFHFLVLSSMYVLAIVMSLLFILLIFNLQRTLVRSAVGTLFLDIFSS